MKEFEWKKWSGEAGAGGLRAGMRVGAIVGIRGGFAVVGLGIVGLLSLGAGDVLAACTAAPSCAALGYTSTTCPEGGVKCPWDQTKMFCKGGSSSIACQSLPPSPGDYLYPDKTYCNKDVHAALITAGQAVKTPIAIVSYVNGSKRLAIQLSNPGAMLWSSDYVDIPGITNYRSSPHTTDFNGKANTAAWVSYYGSTSSYAPGYCNNYATIGTSKGEWYLPAAGELYSSIWTNKAAVNAGLTKVSGAAQIAENWHWSSSEYDYYSAWLVGTNGETTMHGKSYGHSNYFVRCVLAF